MGTFNQREYNAKWRAENMMRVSATYKNDFVLKFREACKELGGISIGSYSQSHARNNRKMERQEIICLF